MAEEMDRAHDNTEGRRLLHSTGEKAAVAKMRSKGRILEVTEALVTGSRDLVVVLKVEKALRKNISLVCKAQV
jgi:hypothetical protein